MPFIKNNNINIHYQTHGTGPLLTIIGGLGDNIRNWGAVAKQLGRHFKLILIDNRGAGLSDRPKDKYSIEDMASDVIALLEHLNINQTHLLGFSMGGKIAMNIAIKRPDLIDRLILVATTAAFETNLHSSEGQIRKLLDGFENSPEHFAMQFEILFSDTYKKKFSPEMFAKFKFEDPHPQTKLDFLAQYEAVRSFDVSKDIHLIISPTLILSGTDDRMTPHQNSEWLHEHIPQSSLILYRDVGHIPQAERTKEFIRDVTVFLQE